ncbi:MAG TPA: ATP-binding protein [Candidatus Syntrophoarchaeum butanivorans]|uniref:ATP-binding protein n=1 Tax=Candidatus Syntropharchaeum butanivorans TaxID=1839936 RepID=A0A7C0X3J7_9EURY|nr:MAG: ATP-binding protein [Candidatus Syntrophoarchaeum sp. WYZ-LMO15]HDM35886.1 ATP-binding protein [Candidatus Syntrophoarchaeum butanivorans]
MTTIVVSGKGGTGKTNVAALIVRIISERKVTLAIDADPDTNLAGALGASIRKTVGDIREGFLDEKDKLPPETDKQAHFEYRLMGIIEEGDRFDILAMGRPEGPGCYCYVNNVLRAIIERLEGNYEVVVIDTEAGLEHLSRRTVRDIDILLVVTDTSRRGLETADRIRKLANELNIRVKQIYVVANKVRDEKDREKLKNMAEEMGLELIGFIPFDEELAELDLDGKPLTQLKDSSPAFKAVKEIVERLNIM